MSMDPSSLRYAEKLLHKGYGYQNAARIAGMNEADLRSMTGGVAARRSTPVPPRYPRAPDPAPPGCGDATLAIIDRIAAKYGLTRRDLLGPNLSRCRMTIVRQAAYAAVREERPHLSLPVIGRIFGGRDHTTVMHGIRQHNARMAWAEFLIAAGSLDDQLNLFAAAA